MLTVLALVGGRGVADAAAATPIACPTTISSPGNYVLTGNCTVSSGDGIDITASNVSLDLGGYTVAGTASTNDGILAASPLGAVLTNINISHGSMTGFAAEGVEFRDVTSGQIDHITSTNSYRGIMLRCCTSSITISSSTASSNVADGILIDAGVTNSFITKNKANNNGFTGIAVSGCTPNATAFCAFGGETTTRNTVSGNTANSNGFSSSPQDEQAGIYIGDDAANNTIVGNAASGNFPAGILVETCPAAVPIECTGPMDNLIQGNKANANSGNGITVQAGATVNTINGNHALTNSAYDLEDDNPGCDLNTWTSNTFKTANQSCIQ